MYGLHLRLHSWQVEILAVDHPWRALDDLCCGKNLFTNETFDDRIAYLEFFRCLSRVTQPSCLWNGSMW